MNNYESQYLSILGDILKNGKKSSNRTGIDTYKVWGRQMHIDLNEGFPLLTTKKIHWKSVVHELLWMISGDTNIQYLLKNGVTFWSEWPYQKYLNSSSENGTSVSSFSSTSFSLKEFEQTIVNNDEFAKQWGSIGKNGYGGMWRDFPVNQYEDRDGGRHKILGIDQVHGVLEELKANPDSRRIIITAWHPYHSNRKEDALLPACHCYTQFGTEELTLGERLRLFEKRIQSSKFPYISNEELDDSGIPKYRLNCYYSMRSNDYFLGNSYNNAFYALFTHLIANQLNMIPGQLVWTAADVHLYSNHIEQAELQLSRTPTELPQIKIKAPSKSIFDIKYEDIELINYNPQSAIKAEVAI